MLCPYRYQYWRASGMKLEELGKLQILTYTVYKRFHSNAGICSELGLMLKLDYSLDDFHNITVVIEIQ
jgi:hypothetical protein